MAKAIMRPPAGDHYAIEPEVLPAECPDPIEGVLKTEWLPQNVDDLDRDES
jgi:hypothetical protein